MAGKNHRQVAGKNNRRHRILSAYILLQKIKVRWAGHVVSVPDSYLPEMLLCFSVLVQSGKENRRCTRGYKKKFKDWLEASFKGLNISLSTWKSLSWTDQLSKQAYNRRMCRGDRRNKQVLNRTNNQSARLKPPPDHLRLTHRRAFKI